MSFEFGITIACRCDRWGDHIPNMARDVVRARVGTNSAAPLFCDMKRNWVAAVALASIGSGCSWVANGINARSYPTLGAGEAGNLVARGAHAYVSLGDSGLGLLDARTGARVGVVPPPPGTESVDDVALDGALLFLLDARAPGHLTVMSLSAPASPVVIATGAVPVGPFSGVTAARGLCVVSGGTSSLSIWKYDATELVGPVATADLGRGQPDALLSSDGGHAFVSTHYRGAKFGFGIVRVSASDAELLGTVALPGAGFTKGGAKPANFPIDAAQLDDNTLLLATGRGLVIADVRDRTHPAITQVLDLDGPAVNVDVLGLQAAVSVAGDRPGVALVTFTPGARPVIHKLMLPPGTNPGAVAFSDGAILVAAREKGVLRLER